jgi:hypothetical protein
MRKQKLNLVRLLVPFVMVLAVLVFPSCGFIGLLFDGDNDDGGERYYDVQISYNYSGARVISEDSPLILLLIPLDSNMQFNDEAFDNATAIPNNFSPGVATLLSVESGPYAMLGFIDEQPFGARDSQVNMGEVYAFYDMKEFVDSISAPDYIMVDSGIETYTPHFELDDSYFMDGFLILSPREGDTLYGEGIGYINAVGFTVDPTIETIEVVVDTFSQGSFPAEQEVFPVNMTTYGTGPHTLELNAYSSSGQIFYDQPPINTPVNFDYVAPD